MAEGARRGNTKAEQVQALVEAATAAGLTVTEIIVEPKSVRLRTQPLVESPPAADAAERWLEERRARKAGGRA